MKTKNVGLFAVFTAFALALFASCSQIGSGGSATLALDTRAIAAKSLAREAVSLADAAEGETEDTAKTDTTADATGDTTADENGYSDTQRYKVVVPYTYDGNTYRATDFFDAEIYVSYATHESEVRNVDAFSLTIDNLPLGKDVTFEMEVYEYHEHEKEAYQGYVEESTPTPFLVSAEPVTATITDDTAVVITLKEYDESPDPTEEEPAKEDPSTPAEEEPGDVAANTTFTLTATFPDDAEPLTAPVIVTLLADENEKPLDIQTNITTTATFSADNPFVTEIKTNAEASDIHYVEVWVFTSEAFDTIKEATLTGAYYDWDSLETLLTSLDDYLLYSGEGKPLSVTEGVTVALELESADEEDTGIDSDKNDEDKTDDTVTEQTPSFIAIPEVENINTVDNDNSFAEILTKFENAAGVYYIRLDKDISYSGTFSYNTNSADSALVLDLNGNDLIITSENAESVFTVNSTMYVINGTIDDRRTAVATTNANLFYNKSTLYLKDVDFRNGKNQAIYQGKDRDQEVGGATYVEDCTVMGYADTTPFYFDKGLAVISNTTFSGNGSVTQTVYNGGELILTGGTTINSGSLALTNAGTALLVGATVNTTIQNNGTLALLSAYTHGETNFVAASGTNTINATDYAIKNGDYATLILDETANISGTVYIDNSSNTIQDVKSKIFVAKGTASFKNHITIAPEVYTNYSVTATSGTAGIDYALVFGIVDQYNNDKQTQALTEVQDVSEDLISYFKIAETEDKTGAAAVTISGTWEKVSYTDISDAYNGYAIKKN